MANEIFKELKTKIALKYNTYEYWTTGEGKDYAPLKGEVCFCAIESKEQGAQTAPTILFKVGVDGTKKFSELKWASALAADVFDWAKVAGGNVFTKDGVGNVVSGIEYDATLNAGKGGFKFTTASVATAEGLEELQETVAAIGKDITDNRDAWNKYEDTRYSFSTDGDKLVVKKTLYTNGVAGTEEAVGTYEFLTTDEVNTILNAYYTKNDADAKFVTGLAEGSTNGTVKAVINGVAGADVAIHGLQDAAYTTVAALNATAKGYADAVEAKLPTSADYGVLEVKGDEASGVVVDKTDKQRPVVKIAANTYDAHGAAAEVQGNLTAYENAHASDYTNTKIDELVQGAKDYADANDTNTAHTHVSGKGIKVDNAGGISGEVKADLNVAFELADKTIKLYDKDDTSKTAIATLDATEFIADGMLASVTADQDNNKLVFEWNTDAGVTKTEIPLSSIADIYTGKTGDEVNVFVSNTNEISASLDSAVTTKIGHGEEAYNWGNHANAGYALTTNLGDLATKDNITHDLVTDFDSEVAKIKVNTAADAEKLGGQLPSYYATAESVTAITKDGGYLDNLRTDAYTYTDEKTIGIKAGNDGEGSTGGRDLFIGNMADGIIDQVSITGNDRIYIESKAAGNITLVGASINFASNVSDESFNVTINEKPIATKEHVAKHVASEISAYNTSKNFGDIISHNVAEFATSTQGGKADTALQNITTTENGGLKISEKENGVQNIDIDTDVVFVLDCNW